MVGEIDVDVVRETLEKPRPGFKVQARMMPRPRAPSVSSEPARDGAVLLLLYPLKGRLHLVLTRRTDRLPSHKGQISLPGGARESGESFVQTALREAHEELNVAPGVIDVLDELTPLYIPPSNYCIRPIVGYTPARPAFHPDPHEVAEVLEVPLAELLDPSSEREEEWPLRGTIVRVPHFAVSGHKVWGATAMVLAEFVDLIRDALKQR